MRSEIMMRRTLAVLLSLSMILTLVGGSILGRANISAESDTGTVAGSSKSPIAHYTFDDEKDRFADSAGNNPAMIVNPTAASLDDVMSSEEGGCLDLTDNDAYLSLPGGLLTGLEQFSVEMRVRVTDTAANWAFFAAPDDLSPQWAKEHYLGILLENGQVKVQRFANTTGRPDEPTDALPVDGQYHTVRVIFGTSDTTLRVDNNEPVTVASSYLPTNCIGENGVLWFGHSSWEGGEGFDGSIDYIKLWSSADDLSNDNLIASFDFAGTGEERLKDGSGNNVQAAVQKLNNISTDGDNGYLDLTTYNRYLPTGTNAYLAVPGTILEGLDAMTVEMRVRTAGADGGLDAANWAFYAAPDGNTLNGLDPDVFSYEKYLGVFLKNNITVERYANNGERPESASIDWTCDGNDWHTVRFVFAQDKTCLYVNGVLYAEAESDRPLANCVSDGGVYDNSVLWFGHAPWIHFDSYGEGFNGCIDDIKIWDYANFDVADPTFEGDESDYIITKDVVERPANTVVNMFDYWITKNQTDNDYRPAGVTSITTQIMPSGINAGHPFLFAGYDSTEYSYGGRWYELEPHTPRGGSVNGYINSAPDVGSWNVGMGNKTRSDIVASLLTADGYPQLSGNTEFIGNFPETTKANITESLAYLFDPDTYAIGKATDDPYYQAGKASYPDVTGLFRLDDNGYYYFNSAASFAELNTRDEDSPKLDHSGDGGNHITLYGKGEGEDVEGAWRPLDPNDAKRSRGQFFPFNDWSDLFHLDDNGQLVQNHEYIYYQNQPGRELLNHHFGMTIETDFIQPVNGMVNHGSDQMVFEFSGDDDVWIFVDDVLVCDIGGLHAKLTAQVNFATGNIRITAPNIGDSLVTATTLKNEFRKAYSDLSDEEFEKQFGSLFSGSTFASGTSHTLKFFYLERGNNVSNAYIRFNFQSIQPDVIHKTDEGGNPLDGASFELYAAELTDKNNSKPSTRAEFNIVQDNNKNDILIASEITTDENGYAEFLDEDGKIIVFANEPYDYYILREKEAPAGYRKNSDIVLRYDRKDPVTGVGTNTFLVVNKYETGAYASFSAYFEQLESHVHTASYTDGSGIVKNDNDYADLDELAKGLAFVVPTRLDGNDWLPLYGSNADTWETVKLTGSYELALLEAVLRQVAKDGAPEMYMTWNNSSKRLSAALEDVPGNAALYTGNQGGSLSQATLFVSADGLIELLGLDPTDKDSSELFKSSSRLFEELKNTLQDPNGLADALNKAGNMAGHLQLLYTGDFDRTYRSDIHITDMQQKLVIRKVDNNKNPLADAEFALYSNSELAAKGQEQGRLITGTTDADGILVMTFTPDKLEGGLEDGRYYLREIKAPLGYMPNTGIIEIVVTNGYIFANASAYEYVNNGSGGRLEKIGDNDNVKVYAAVGNIADNLVRFTDDDILDDLQLANITGKVYTAVWSSGAQLASAWSPADDEPFALHYYVYSALQNYVADTFDPQKSAGLAELGIADAADGFVSVKPVKNGIDLSSMFSLLNVVEIVNEPADPIKVENDPGEGKTVKPGDTIKYSITWGNSSTETAALTIEDPLDSNVDFVSASYGNVTLKAQKDENGKVTYVTTGTDSNVTIKYDAAARTVTWVIRNVPSGGYVQVDLEVEVNENIGKDDEVVNQANVINDKINVWEKTQEVKNPVADLDIRKDQSVNGGARTTNRLIVQEDDRVTYYLTVTVNGTEGEEIKGVVVQDMVPVGLILDKSSLTSSKEGTKISEPQYYTTADGGKTYVLEWRLGDVAVGEVITLTYTVTVPHVDKFTEWDNTAFIISDIPDNTSPEHPRDPKHPKPWEPSNTVEIEDPVGSLTISKAVQDDINDSPDTNQSFEFTVTLKDSEGNALTGAYRYCYVDADGNKLAKGGTVRSGGKVTLKHGETVIIEGLPAGAQYTVEESNAGAYIGYEETVKASSASGVIDDGAADNVHFVNIYGADGQLQFEISKTVEGRPWNSGETFTFEVTTDDPATLTAIKDKKINLPGGGNSFTVTVDKEHPSKLTDVISFTDVSGAEPYRFTVSEIKPADYSGNLEYSETVYELLVTVVDPDRNGKLMVAGSFTADGELIKGTDDTAMEFINVYEAEPVTADFTLNISKTLKGRSWNSKDKFTFELTAYDEATAEALANGDITVAEDKTTVVITKKGQDTDISFGAITFNFAGEFSFLVSETNKTQNNIIYDKSVYVVTVKVIDDQAEGKLKVDSVTVTKLKKAGAELASGTAVAPDESVYTLNFVNTYDEPEPTTTTTPKETEPPETEPETETEPPETEPETETEPPETEPVEPQQPTTTPYDPSLFNIFDDGLPRGDQDLDDPNNRNLPTGVVLMITPFIAAAVGVIISRKRK